MLFAEDIDWVVGTEKYAREPSKLPVVLSDCQRGAALEAVATRTEASKIGGVGLRIIGTG